MTNHDPAPAIYDQLLQLSEQGQKSDALDALIQYVDQAGQYHELFEALKMKLRWDLGLPAAQVEPETPLDEETEIKLERGLIAACRRVGEAFFRAGKIRDGWMYLRPVGDPKWIAEITSRVQVTDENFDDLQQVLLHEGVDIRRGYQLSLERLGTCNSITLFEQALASRPRSDQQVAAELLVRHVHRELLANLRGDIQRREGNSPVETTAEEILQARPDLLKSGSYHLDTSHLASTVRFARVVDDPAVLRLALDIAHYGRKLHPQYQYPGEEPFLDLYPASIAFFRALLGQQVEAGIRYFTQKADSVDQGHYGLLAFEVLIDLLSRCGRHAEAITALDQRVPSGSRTLGIAPSLLQLSQRLGDYRPMQELAKHRGDLLSYTAALMRS
ncbi:MAG TPA: hypothetical protein DCF63_01360 [Planctomycetaceae bacterium]|nr:hypothetical protein [Planctomycetaceae bacterium]